MEIKDYKNMFEYKINVLEALANAGYNTYRIRKEKIISEASLQQIRKGNIASWTVMGFLCEVLKCDVGDIVTYNPDKAIEPKQANKPRGKSAKKEELTTEE